MGSLHEIDKWLEDRDRLDRLALAAFHAHRDTEHPGFCDQGCGPWPCKGAHLADLNMTLIS